MYALLSFTKQVTLASNDVLRDSEHYAEDTIYNNEE